ncbi:MAG TPA: alpha-galactosidase [Feifaniaceae bacterium]|nr:alpha-galactosidase [Feifaniaceae bacterium]
MNSHITEENGVFRLHTKHTSYWFRVTGFGHIEHIHYGERIQEGEIEPLLLKRTAYTGGTVLYDQSDPTYSLDTLLLEWSGIGKGDFRQTPAELLMPDGTFTADFTYKSCAIFAGTAAPEGLPGAYGGEEECETLRVTLEDAHADATLDLYYTVFPETDVITRRCVLKNNNESPLTIRRLMSMMLDIPNRNYVLTTFDGGWIKEAHRHDRPLQYGMFVNESTTGNSSNRHNPGFLLYEEGANENWGRVYGFNLVYSGNHYSAAELSAGDTVRIVTGVSPHCFLWTLKQGECFHTPEAVLTFSNNGFNGMSQKFHAFIGNHIVRGPWKDKERPVLLNNWEAHFFKFSQRKLLGLARRAKRLGVELFVLDDGWFGKRDSDTAGLGDYSVNRRKLPRGIGAFAKRIRRTGMQFGLWFEPECVNEDSDCFRLHPDWAVRVPGREPARGRNQLHLDLCNPEVRDYIVKNVRGILEEGRISYVKWDMNRHMTDCYSPHVPHQGEFFHRCMLGLYEVLHRIFDDKPEILLEMCASGGNRFDLGMLCFAPQIWASDDTDPVERLKIQGGLSYLYPPSAMGAHVSSAPHQQTLRDTPLPTRFHAACFGCLGYELDLKYLTPAQKREVRAQIDFYKRHRRTFQYGRFYRLEAGKRNRTVWESLREDGEEALVGFFQTKAHAAEGYDRLPVLGLNKAARYTVETRPQGLRIKSFGALIHHILPFRVHPEGVLVRAADANYMLPDCVERYEGYGDALMAGILLNNQFIGSHYNKRIRLLGDFGSNVYLFTKQKGETV